MASRVNTRIVLIVVGALGLALVTLGGLYYLRLKNDTTRHIRAGQELEAKGDPEQAYGYYYRALEKQPDNPEYLRNVERVLMEIRPQNAEKATDYYGKRLALLNHAIQYRSKDPEAHLELIRERTTFAMLASVPSLWRDVAQAAEEMLTRVPTGDPKYVYGKLYRGLAGLRSEVSRTPEQAQAAEDDLRAFIESGPKDDVESMDIAWASLAASQLATVRDHRIAGRMTRYQETRGTALKTMADALAAMPDQPEVARANAVQLYLRNLDSDPDVSVEDVKAASARLLQIAEAIADPSPTELISVCDTLYMLDRTNGFKLAAPLLDKFLASHPEALYHWLVRAKLAQLSGEFDEAIASATTILESGPMKVGLISGFQHDLKTQAAGVLVDVAFRRWETAENEAQRAEALKAIEAGRETLIALVTDKQTDLSLLRADAKMALARGEQSTAVAKFEEYIKRGGENDVDMLLYSAGMLERVGELGRAHQRYAKALEQQPGHLWVMLAMARLEGRMGRLDDAQKNVDAVIRANPEFPDARRVAAEVVAARAKLDSSGTQPGATSIYAEAEAAFLKQDYEGARALLLPFYKADAKDINVLMMLARVEFESGQREMALNYVKEALAISPNNPAFKGMQATLENDNPVDAAIAFLNETQPNPTERTILLYVNLDVLAEQRAAQAEQLAAAGNAAEAEKLRAVAEHAANEAERYHAEAERLAPEDPRVIGRAFERALNTANWQQAEQLIARAKSANADQAGGLVYQGALQLQRGQAELAGGNKQQATQFFEAAVRHLTEATTRKDYSSTAWRLLASAYEQLSNYTEAKRAYEQAYLCNPNDLTTIRRYMAMLIRIGEPTRALAIMRTARTLVPNDPAMQDVWLQLEAEVGETRVAIRERTRIYKDSPANQTNALRLASLMVTTEARPEDAVDRNGRPIYDKASWNQRPVQEQTSILKTVKTNWLDESEKILNALPPELLQAPDVVLVRAKLQRQRGDSAGADQTFVQYVAGVPAAERSDALILYSQFLLDSGRYDQAIEPLQEALKYQAPDGVEVDSALGELHFHVGRYDQAATHFKKVLEKTGNSTVRSRLAECYTKTRQFDLAEPLLAQMIKDGGRTLISLLLLSTVEDGRGVALHVAGKADEAARKFEQADQIIAEAARNNPDSGLPHAQRAQHLLGRFAVVKDPQLLDQALAAIDQSERVQPDSITTSRTRVAVLQEKGDAQATIGALTRFLQRWPDDIPFRQRLIQMYVDQRNIDAAIELDRQAIERFPTAAGWWEGLGQLLALKNDFPGAVEAYKRAYQLQPLPSVLARLADLLVSGPNPDFAAAIDLLKSNEQAMQENPLLREIYARALGRTNQREAALEQLRLAYAQRRADPRRRGAQDLDAWFFVLRNTIDAADPQAIEQFVMSVTENKPSASELLNIARSWRISGSSGLGRAAELLTLALERAPEDQKPLRATLYKELADCNALMKNYPAAVEAYSKSFELRPDDPSALNNAAYVLSHFMNDHAKAATFAEKAVQIAPENPDYLDTQGAILLELGRFDEAEPPLRKSMRIRETAPCAVHLAKLLWKKGDNRNSQNYLRRAEELRPDEATVAEIARLRDDMKNSPQ